MTPAQGACFVETVYFVAGPPAADASVRTRSMGDITAALVAHVKACQTVKQMRIVVTRIMPASLGLAAVVMFALLLASAVDTRKN
ncbi:hypothetical protein HJFPF1_10323 [Paramyrothecium foliicola]|nr:hypothetical protein HJFPF1_10323 [Paramyrothecium foliicola]